MDIFQITAIVGAITGCASLIWNMTTYLGFDLELYSHYLSFGFKKKNMEHLLILTGQSKDVSNYSDDVIMFNGWFKFLLRKEGQRFKNHHVSLLGIELDEEIRKLLSNILAEPFSDITLFPNKEAKDLKLFEGTFLEVEVHSNHLFLKKDWKRCMNLQLNELAETINELIKKENYKVNVHLTTYKYPLIYKKKDNCFQRECLRKRAAQILRRPLKI